LSPFKLGRFSQSQPFDYRLWNRWLGDDFFLEARKWKSLESLLQDHLSRFSRPYLQPHSKPLDPNRVLDLGLFNWNRYHGRYTSGILRPIIVAEDPETFRHRSLQDLRRRLY
jgi:hypothetical protein